MRHFCPTMTGDPDFPGLVALYEYQPEETYGCNFVHRFFDEVWLRETSSWSPIPYCHDSTDRFLFLFDDGTFGVCREGYLDAALQALNLRRRR